MEWEYLNCITFCSFLLMLMLMLIYTPKHATYTLNVSIDEGVECKMRLPFSFNVYEAYKFCQHQMSPNSYQIDANAKRPILTLTHTLTIKMEIVIITNLCASTLCI